MVIPIVLYIGTRKWNVKKSIQECQTEIPEQINMNIGEYNIVDVNDYTNDELEADEFFYSKMMLLEKLTKEEEIFQTLGRIAENEKDETNKLLLKRIIALILKGKLSEEKIESEEIDMMLEVIEKGYEKQRKLGKLEGILETARELLKFGMNKEDIQKVTKLTKKANRKITIIKKI